MRTTGLVPRTGYLLTCSHGPGVLAASINQPCGLLDGRDPLPCISNYRSGILFCCSMSPVFSPWFVRKAAKFSFCLSYFQLGFCHLYTGSGISLLWWDWTCWDQSSSWDGDPMPGQAHSCHLQKIILRHVKIARNSISGAITKALC